MCELEKLMARALGDQFTHYVGKDQQLIQRDPHKQSFMGHREKRLLADKLKKVEEFRRKHYLDGKYSFQRVLDITCAIYLVPEHEILSARRVTRLVRARQQIIRIQKEQRGMSWTELGQRLGRDHSTVIHSYISYKNNPLPLQEAYEEIMERLDAYST